MFSFGSFDLLYCVVGEGRKIVLWYKSTHADSMFEKCCENFLFTEAEGEEGRFVLSV